MKLADLVARYPTARLATPADNARILDFFEQTPMRTSAFDVQYRRRPDFFQLLRYQSDRSFVIVSEDAAGAVRSVGTISLRPGWMGGQPTTIGYLGDLRIAFDRELARAWRRLFADLLTQAHDIDELADCTQWFTAVLDTNRAALTALRRRGGDARQPSLVPIAPFTMRNLIMRLPLAGRGASAAPWRVCDARAQDRDALTTFFEDGESPVCVRVPRRAGTAAVALGRPLDRRLRSRLRRRRHRRAAWRHGRRPRPSRRSCRACRRRCGSSAAAPGRCRARRCASRNRARRCDRRT